ncbi:hypothetical protein [Streptomyces albus]|uniref:hypothetical protein n=1 Tax=Streptomyces albus TaxID=1888 RepID=UPI0004CB64EA|nr:hypothetical protein [Streptomyces albus]
MDLLTTLDGYFGGWCLTFTALPPREALQAMEAGHLSGVAGPVDALREEADEGIAEDRILLVAGRISPTWSMVIETNGSTGLIGAGRCVLLELCTPEQPATTVFKNPDGLELLYADLNDNRAGLDITSGRRWGAFGHVSGALHAAGFTAHGSLHDTLSDRSYNDLARRAITAVTDLRTLKAGTTGWVSGVVPTGTALQQTDRSRALSR